MIIRDRYDMMQINRYTLLKKFSYSKDRDIKLCNKSALLFRGKKLWTIFVGKGDNQ